MPLASGLLVFLDWSVPWFSLKKGMI